MPNDTAPAWLNARGSTLEEMRQNVLGTDLWKRGDTLLVWVNEGDLWMLGVAHKLAADTRQRERAAYAAGAEAMREAMREAAYEAFSLDKQLNISHEAWAYAFAAVERIRALPIPADASAALAEVVRKAVERERGAIMHIVRNVVDTYETERILLESIRARSTEGTP